MKKKLVISIMCFALVWTAGLWEAGVNAEGEEAPPLLEQEGPLKDKTLPSEDTLIPLRAQAGTSRKVYPVDKIAAVVDDEVITQRELEKDLFPVYVEYKNVYAGEEFELKIDEARRSILSRLIDNKLILREAKKIELEISPERIDENIAKIQAGFKNEAEFEKALAKRGLMMAGLRKRVEEQLMVEEMIDRKITAHIVVTPTETTQYYKDHLEEFKLSEMVRLRSILISVPDKDMAVQVTEEALKKLRAGKEFSKVSDELSGNTEISCTVDSRWVKRGEMKPEIEKLIFALEAGAYSDIVSSALGCYIFEAEEKKPAAIKEFPEVESVIRNIFYRKKAVQEYTKWVDELKENAYISIK